jgi:hypothetical protein
MERFRGGCTDWTSYAENNRSQSQTVKNVPHQSFLNSINCGHVERVWHNYPDHKSILVTNPAPAGDAEKKEIPDLTVSVRGKQRKHMVDGLNPQPV